MQQLIQAESLRQHSDGVLHSEDPVLRVAQRAEQCR